MGVEARQAHIDALLARWVALPRRPRVITVGNEKGGAGKSTTALHLIISLLKDGYAMGSLDLDGRQATLTRGLENRYQLCQQEGVNLPGPDHLRVPRSDLEGAQAWEDERDRLWQALREVAGYQVLVIDTPGADTPLSRMGHALADVLVTPVNDSFVDLDVLAQVTLDGKRVARLSLYSQMVWEHRKTRARAGLSPMHWIVLRNRIPLSQGRNESGIANVLEEVSQRAAFEVIPGMGDRPLFREMWPRGLTLLDLKEPGLFGALNMSHVTARNEVRGLISAVKRHLPPANN